MSGFFWNLGFRWFILELADQNFLLFCAISTFQLHFCPRVLAVGVELSVLLCVIHDSEAAKLLILGDSDVTRFINIH